MRGETIPQPPLRLLNFFDINNLLPDLANKLVVERLWLQHSDEYDYLHTGEFEVFWNKSIDSTMLSLNSDRQTNHLFVQGV